MTKYDVKSISETHSINSLIKRNKQYVMKDVTKTLERPLANECGGGGGSYACQIRDHLLHNAFSLH